MKTAPATQTFRKPRFVMSGPLPLSGDVPLVPDNRARPASTCGGRRSLQDLHDAEQATDASSPPRRRSTSERSRSVCPEFEEIVLPGDDYAQAGTRCRFRGEGEEKTSVSWSATGRAHSAGRRRRLAVPRPDGEAQRPMVLDAPAGGGEKSRRSAATSWMRLRSAAAMSKHSTNTRWKNAKDSR